MKKNIIYIFVSVIVFSCQPILRTVTGIKKPKIESFESIKDYIENNNLPIETSRNLFLSSNDDYKKLSKLRDSLFRLPDIYLFNKSGWFLEENLFCLSLKKQSINKLDNNYFNQIFKTDSIISKTKKITYLEKFLITSEKENVIFDNESDIAIILWAKFLGDKKNSKHIIESKRSLEDVDNTISIYYLNIDTLDFWDE